MILLIEFSILCLIFILSGNRDRFMWSLYNIAIVYFILVLLSFFAKTNMILNSSIRYIIIALGKRNLKTSFLAFALFVYIIWKITKGFYKYEIYLIYFAVAVYISIAYYVLFSEYQIVMNVVMGIILVISLQRQENQGQNVISIVVTIGIAIITLYQGALEQAESKATDSLNTTVTVGKEKGKISFYGKNNNEFKVNAPKVTFYPKTGFITHIFYFAPVTGKNNTVEYKYYGSFDNTNELDNKNALLYNLKRPFYIRTSAFRKLSHAVYDNKINYYYCYVIVEGANQKKQEYIIIYRIKKRKLVGKTIVFNYDDFLYKKNIGFLNEDAYNEMEKGAQWAWNYVKNNNL